MPVEPRPIQGCQTYVEWLREMLRTGDIAEFRRVFRETHPKEN